MPGDPVTVGESLPQDKIFDLLSSHRRRYVLHACKRLEAPVSLSTLAEQVAAWEYGKNRSDLTSDERHRVYTSIQQTHLPAMARASIVEYDQRTVELTENANHLEVYMDIVPEQTISWANYYLGLSVLSTLLVLGVWAGVYPSLIPDLAAGLIVALFLPSSVYHAWRSRRMRVGRAGTPPEVGE